MSETTPGAAGKGNVWEPKALESLVSTVSPAIPTLPFAVGIAGPSTSAPARPRAPKGGTLVAGRFYRGGTFLPATANPRDEWPEWTDERWTVAERPASDIDLTAFAPIAPAGPTRFAINGFTYTASEVPAGECGTVAYELHRLDTNHRYHVIRDHYGLVKCDCPDFLFRCDGTGQTCKHGSKLVAMGMVPAPTPVASTLGRREFLGPDFSILRTAEPDRVVYPSRRPRRFEPTPEDMAEAAQLFADVAFAGC